MSGMLFIVGVGPGDPELITLKAARILGAVPACAFFAKRGRPGHARITASRHLNPAASELRFDYPFTTEVPHTDPAYVRGMASFYEAAATSIAARLDAGIDVALLCEGDPFFYGSAMYLYDRLAPRYPHETIPGVTGMSGCWTQAGLPMTHGDDVLTVLPGTLDEPTLAARLHGTDAAVIMKIGRNLEKIRRALDAAGRTDAVYVERGTMDAERVLNLADLTHAPAPYFAMVLVPGRQRPR